MRAIIIPIAFAILLSVIMVYQAMTIEPRLCEAPKVSLAEIPGFTSEVIPVSEAERYTLPEDTLFDKRVYSAADGAWFQVTIVVGGRSKSSIHRPEMCLPSQGFQMGSPRDIEIAGTNWHLVSLAKKDATSMGFAYTFFNQDGFHTSSHIRRIFRDVWDRSVLGRIDRWVMVTVYSSIADDFMMSRFLLQLKRVIEK